MALTVCVLSFSTPLLLLLVLLLPLLSSAQRRKQPHLVVIMADDLGCADVEYIDKNMHSPNINKLKDTGVTFKWSYMLKSCSPSRGTFFTGINAYKMGMQDRSLGARKNNSLPLDKRTFPQDLQDLGYSTHLVGKWHLGFCKPEMTPTYRGFHTFYGMYNGENDYFTHRYKLGGYDMHNNIGRSMSVDWSAQGIYSTHLFTNKAVEIIRNHDSSRPMFLFLSYQAVHGPLQVPGWYINNTKCAKVVDNNRRMHCAMVAAMDEGIGKVMEALDKNKFSENLITLFMSDNGGPVNFGSSNWPLRGSKTTEWEGGTRVVTILNSKRHLPAAPYTWNGLMHATDWYPTLLRMAGKKVDTSRMDGNDNWPSIANNTMSQTREFVYNINEINDNRAIRSDQYKLLRFGSPSPYGWYYPGNYTIPKKPRDWMFFDIHQDPEERNDMYPHASSTMKIKIKALEKKLQTYREELVHAKSLKQLIFKDDFITLHNETWRTGWC